MQVQGQQVKCCTLSLRLQINIQSEAEKEAEEVEETRLMHDWIQSVMNLSSETRNRLRIQYERLVPLNGFFLLARRVCNVFPQKNLNKSLRLKYTYNTYTYLPTKTNSILCFFILIYIYRIWFLWTKRFPQHRPNNNKYKLSSSQRVVKRGRYKFVWRDARR